MDFIVLGGVLGALFLGVGLLASDVLPRRLASPSDDVPWTTVSSRRRLARTARSTGRVAAAVGVAVLVVTVALVLAGASDGTGLRALLGFTLLGLIGGGGLVAWYRYAESSGAMQRRQMRAVRSRLQPPAADATGGGRRSAPRGEGRAAPRDRPDVRGRRAASPDRVAARGPREGAEGGWRDDDYASPSRSRRPVRDDASAGRPTTGAHPTRPASRPSPGGPAGRPDPTRDRRGDPAGHGGERVGLDREPQRRSPGSRRPASPEPLDR